MKHFEPLHIATHRNEMPHVIITETSRVDRGMDPEAVHELLLRKMKQAAFQNDLVLVAVGEVVFNPHAEFISDAALARLRGWAVKGELVVES